MTSTWSAEKKPVSTVNPYASYIRRIRLQLRRKPKSPRLHTILGRLQQKAGLWKQAEASYRKALHFSKQYSHALVGLAHLALRKGKVVESRHYLQRVLRRNPNHVPALAKQSEWYRWRALRAKSKKKRQKLLKQAAQTLQRALKLRPQAHQYRYRLGLLHLALHQHFQAHQQFALAETQHRLHPCYHVGALMSEAMMVRKDDVYQKLRHWLSRCRHPLMTQMAQGVWMAYEIQKAQKQASHGKRKEAIQGLKKSILLAPNAPSGYLYLTLLLSQDQRCWEARKTLTQLLSRYPNHREAKKLLSHSRALRCKSKRQPHRKTSTPSLHATPHPSLPQPSSPPVRKTTP